MMLGARTAAWAKAGGWVNQYVTDGLVAMWDGDISSETTGGVVDIVSGLVLQGQIVNGRIVNVKGASLEISGVRLIERFASIKTRGSSAFTIMKIVNADTVVAIVNARLDKEITANWLNLGPGYFFVKRGYDFYDSTISLAVEDSRAVCYLDGTKGASKSLSFVGSTGIEIGQFSLKEEIGCIRAYSRALTAEEIAQNYAIDKARFNLP